MLSSFARTLSESSCASQEAGPAAFEPYQGLLYMTEDYRVYGYISCTRVKFLITVDDMVSCRRMRCTCYPAQSEFPGLIFGPATPWDRDTQHEFKEVEMRDIFKKLHAAYADAVSNPFQARLLQTRSILFQLRRCFHRPLWLCASPLPAADQLCPAWICVSTGWPLLACEWL